MHLHENSGFVLLVTTSHPTTSTLCNLLQLTVVEIAVHEQSYTCAIETEIPVHLHIQNNTFGCHINNNKGVPFLGKGDPQLWLIFMALNAQKLQSETDIRNGTEMEREGGLPSS